MTVEPKRRHSSGISTLREEGKVGGGVSGQTTNQTLFYYIKKNKSKLILATLVESKY